LNGLDGNDTLTSGLGQDQFIFAAAPSRGNVDLIQDFTRGQDQLVLDALIFGGTGLHDRQLDATMFRSGAHLSTAGDSNDHVIYDTSAGKLYYDADGAGGAAAMQIATLANAPALDAGSIFILH
jgi:serralysin